MNLHTQSGAKKRGGLGLNPPLALRKFCMYIVKNNQLMNNHLNMLPEQAKFDLKCSKMRWRLGLRPRPHWGSLRRSPRPPSRKGLRIPEIPGIQATLNSRWEFPGISEFPGNSVDRNLREFDRIVNFKEKVTKFKLNQCNKSLSILKQSQESCWSTDDEVFIRLLTL